ncbi:MAG: endonuclease/exonuclease/phosphatase family protein [Crocosphaera sp.]|nr:endonuclease/exonuclease/phosphatase family protein [Crocosphaera sp.]
MYCLKWSKKPWNFLISRVVALICICLLTLTIIPGRAFAQTVPSSPEITTLIKTSNQLTVAAVNVKNLNPFDSSSRFSRLGDLIAKNLQGPDIIALSEIQDNDGSRGGTNSTVTAADRTYAKLADAIEVSGGPAYRSIDITPVDDTNGGQPGGNIRVGFLFNPQRVSLEPGSPGNATTAVQVSDDTVPTLTLNPGNIEPNNPAFANSRKPLIAAFNFNGEKVFVIANHFSSKRGGRRADIKRERQGQAVQNFVAQILEDDADSNVVVAGDLNDFANSPTLNTLAGDVLQNLLDFLPRDDRFTFDFRGNLQVLDHILVSQNLLFDGNAEFDIVHANIRQSNPASDHDPVLARFTFAQTDTPLPSPPIKVTPPTTSVILPDFNGDELERRLAEDFAVKNSLSYRRARDYMYGQIDNDNGTVMTLYANFPAKIPNNVNTARSVARDVGVNAEHSWPQGRGTRQGKARSDLPEKDGRVRASFL